jgi:hypothetical protein
MVADIARVSYDPTRQYRSLISQQGRVTLEADNNEATILEVEALRLETIDIMCPAGTPDNGYAVGSGSGPGRVSIGKGIYYLGGWRLQLDEPIDLSHQPDWVNAPEFSQASGNLVVSLLLTEQSVCAIEDRALREVALGGPDFAARLRLMQHFLRVPTKAATCPAGGQTIAELLEEDGVTIDPATLQLLSSARLQAAFATGPTSQDPCTPAAAGGYLGADNQLVRVTVTQYDAAAKTGTLLWGWNNASLLYRATMSDPLTLTLIDTPVDQEHAPQQNQFVEILRTESELGDNNYIAAGQGFVVQLAQGYSFDTQQIALQTALLADYQNNPDPLFVRLWQAEVPFNAGTATPLDQVSGITVAITMDALPTHIADRPFWCFAVRPSMPQNIYPQRYADAPQPPEGPRQWITDLAIVEAQKSGSTLVMDCRIPFLPLTQQSGSCCDLILGPEEVAGRGGLQAVVDALAGSPAVLSLRAGTYPLSAPLTLGKQHRNLTIEGCTAGAILQAAGTDLTPFRAGLVVFAGVIDITLRRLEFNAPAVPVAEAGVEISTICGVRVGAAISLTIEECVFTLEAPSPYTVGAGVMVLDATLQVSLRHNNFSGTGGREMFGVLAVVTETDASAELDQWEISGNRFTDLAYGVVGFAQLGLIECRNNVVTGCATGFVFVEANIGDTSAFAREAITRAENNNLGPAAQVTLWPDLLADMVNKVAPIQNALPPPAPQPVSAVARQALADQLRTSGTAIYQNLAAGAAPAAPPGTAPSAPTAPGGTAAPATTVTTPGAGLPAIDTAAFDKLDAVAAELTERQLTPALRFADNEVTLTSDVTTPWVGIGAILSPDEPGSVLVNGNRVVVPDATTAACGMLFPAGAVVTGNLFAQLAAAPEGANATGSLILVTNSPAIMVSANVISRSEQVLPARTTQAATTSWEFLNTVG